jgi:N-hydroxyarylamine O-acetyltransferase
MLYPDLVPLDVDAYLTRTGYAGSVAPTAEVLGGLHLAHATHVPFENLDVYAGRPVRLDLDSLQAKLVRSRRGGYCFEQNSLFAAVLYRLGFRVTPFAARVRYRTTGLLPRTHMLLRVDLTDGPYLADVGFGGEGLLLPVPLVPGRECRQFLWTCRVIREGELWVLQARHGETWADQYAFSEEPQHLVDFEVANYFVSTYPESIFRKMRTAQLPTPTGRYVLRDYELTTDRGEKVDVRTVHPDEIDSLLKTLFGIDPPSI